MEKSPSLTLRDDPPPPLRATPPSLVQRTVRALLAPALLGGALATGTAMPSADVAAQDPVKEERKEEDPLLAKFRQELSSLIAEIDSDSFRVRELAQRRLAQIVLGWVREKQQAFPLIASLAPKGGYSLEQQRRLGSILAAHENMELQLLWRPTIFREPREWKERKTPLRIAEVLSALGKQAGRRITLARSMEDRVVNVALDGKTFWQAMMLLREHAGSGCRPSIHHDGSMVICPDAGDTYAVDGNTIGRVQRCLAHPCDPESRIDMEIMADAMPIAAMHILTATGVTDKGRKVEMLDERKVTGQWSPKSATVLTVAVEEGEERMDATVTALLYGYETRVEAVRDCTKETKFSVGPYELYITAKYREAERGPPWSIGMRLSGGGEEDAYDRQRLLNVIQCQAFDAKGAPVECIGPWDTTWRFFAAEPHRLELVLPLRCTSMQKTLTFKGIPLH